MTSDAATAVEPIRLEIEVEADPQAAFDTFTERMGEWWPADATWSRGAFESIGIEPRVGGFAFERGPYGLRLDWGRVTAWEPPHRLAFSWQIEMDRTPQPNPAHASEVSVEFAAAGERTRVTLTHDGFGRHDADAQAYRGAMASDEGWPRILDQYAARVRRSVEAPWTDLTT